MGKCEFDRCKHVNSSEIVINKQLENKKIKPLKDKTIKMILELIIQDHL